MKSAIVPILYAVVLLLAGLNAYSMAPPQANAATALMVPGICAGIMLLVGLLVGVMSGKAARRVHLVGVLFVVLFMFAFVGRAIPSMSAANKYQQADQQWQEALEQNLVEDTPEAKAAYFEERGAPDHSKMYLAFTLFGLSAVSALTFVLMLATPPRKQKDLPASDVREPGPGEA